jgi:hypothetical protein
MGTPDRLSTVMSHLSPYWLAKRSHPDRRAVSVLISFTDTGAELKVAEGSWITFPSNRWAVVVAWKPTTGATAIAAARTPRTMRESGAVRFIRFPSLKDCWPGEKMDGAGFDPSVHAQNLAGSYPYTPPERECPEKNAATAIRRKRFLAPGSLSCLCDRALPPGSRGQAPRPKKRAGRPKSPGPSGRIKIDENYGQVVVMRGLPLLAVP